ncbi:(2Fe-2S)-binding protein [Catenovulum sp. 2E275]|uniref:(2Fe-2S)-binding protein n=1 Tax=Catenovulum sp. 2E275 TaxID=2980497 RepID=UPI0021D17187|nr:(2Fe-2S)-binding protein [Catenovulum sp. 2E275]MCU4674078.1 (2Fe-2S)-binding protein [Catenovulum sp. 2E275]
MPVTIELNGKKQTIDASPSTPILWVIRDQLNLTGTKFGCGMAMCGACTVHLDGQPIRSCSTPLQVADGKKITTIEGVSQNNNKAIIVQKAWEDLQVPQCGYCQSGQIMSAVALLENKQNPTDEEIDAAMSGNICRCSTYVRIRSAIKTAAKQIADAK